MDQSKISRENDLLKRAVSIMFIICDKGVGSHRDVFQTKMLFPCNAVLFFNFNYLFTGRYCGKSPPVVFGTTLSLYITFHSDELRAFKGFKAEWRGGAKGKLDKSYFYGKNT